MKQSARVIDNNWSIHLLKGKKEEIDKFYDTVQKQIEETPKHAYLAVSGDFNVRIEKIAISNIEV